LILTGGALMPTMAPAAIATVGTIKGAQSAWTLTNLAQAIRRISQIAPSGVAITRSAEAAALSGGR
jgi:hypothetical protein